jgi:type I restriction enzyme S subunit
LDSEISHSEALRQSILKKAFSGQLVPQNPNDEPASVLLERIRAEKAQTNIQPARRRGKTA